jgi:hypothetical protein
VGYSVKIQFLKQLIEDLNYEKRRLAKEQRAREMETQKAIQVQQ